METIEVVIRIPKKEYDYMIANPTRYNVCDDEILLYNYIKNGTPLPKGHGKLIDSNVLWDAFQDLGQDFYEAFDFAEANAVIEADKEA
jgi:hypothetical protein